MGSVRKIGNTWYYSFETAKVDGKRKRIERKGGDTKKEALAALRAAMHEYDRSGQLFDEHTMSTSDYLDYWYDNYVMINLKRRSQQYYKQLITNHLKPIIGHYKLNALKPGTLQDLINSKSLNGLSKSSVSNIFGVLSKSMRMAVYPYKFIKENPMSYVSMPKRPEMASEEEIIVLTQEEFTTIIDRFPLSSNFYFPLQIAFHTGLRAAEVCGLTWDNIDFTNKTLTVDKIYNYIGMGRFEYGTPKTTSSYRTIQISDQLLNELKICNKMQKENRLKYGSYYYESNHVCTKENGESITTNSLKYLSRVVNYELNICFNFHSLRHTHASMLLAAGANIKAIQKRLGHSKLATTMDTYAHLTPEIDDHTASILNNISSNGN